MGLVARPVFKTGLRPSLKAVAVRFPRIPRLEASDFRYQLCPVTFDTQQLALIPSLMPDTSLTVATYNTYA